MPKSARSCAAILWAFVTLTVPGLGLTQSTADAAPAPPRPLFTGITGVYSADYQDPAALAHVKASGASYVRIALNWARVAPAKEPSDWQPTNPADPNYDWSAVDTAVVGAVAQGLTPLVSVEWAPVWAQACRSPAAYVEAPCGLNPAAFASFATAAARRYSGTFEGLPRVRYWQGLNEPNLSLFLNPQFEGDNPVSPTDYRKLLNAFYAAVKSVNSSNLVVAAGLGPIAVPHYTIGPMRFTRLLLCMEGHRRPHASAGNCEGGVHFDIFDMHPYTTGAPFHKGGANDVEMGDLGKLQRLLRAADNAGRIKGQLRQTPLWITELSWDSNPPDPGGLALGTETRWTAESMYLAWKAGVSHFFWYSLRDSPPNPKLPFSETLQSGLYFRGASISEDSPKEYFYAFRFPFVAYHPKGKLTYWGRTPSSTGGRVTIQIQRGRRWRSIATIRAGANGIFRGAIATGYGKGGRGAVRAKFGSEISPGFSMHPSTDFYQPPFG
jgi:hypothetical protein